LFQFCRRLVLLASPCSTARPSSCNPMGGSGEAGTAEQAAACSAAARAGELVVFADFDRTLTRCFLPCGGRGASAHGVIEGASLLSETFRGQAKQLFDKYYPVEIDEKMSIEEKIPIMNDWYSEMHTLMLGEDVTRANIRRAVTSCDTIQLREGMAEFLQRCQDSSPPIPVLIMSAGLGDVIEEFLRQRLPFELKPSTMVVSNRMNFDTDGRLIGFSEPLLHMFNKTAAFMPEAGRKLVDGKRHALLIGDSIGDLTMADGLDIEKFKVGLLNEKVEERLKQYQELFDVVVTHDGPAPDICFEAIAAERN